MIVRGGLAGFLLMLLAAGLLADTVVLKNGKRYDGKILSETADSLTMDVRVPRGRADYSWERHTIARADLASLLYEDLSDVAGDLSIPRDPDYNSIMFCPTPATLPKGDFYFRDFELYILNFGWAIRESTSLSLMTHFPVVSFMDFGSIGFKQRLVDREEHAIGLAVAGSYTFGTEDIARDSFLTGTLVAGGGNRERSVNVALNQAWKEGEETELFVVAGADSRTSRRSKIFVEYMNSTTFIDDDDFNGILNLGIRFFGTDWSFSLSGIRPLENTGSLFLIPMFQFSYHAD